MADLSCGRGKKRKDSVKCSLPQASTFICSIFKEKSVLEKLELFSSLFLQRCQEAGAGNDDAHILFVKIGAWICFSVFQSTKELRLITMLTPFRHSRISAVGPNFAAFDKC